MDDGTAGVILYAELLGAIAIFSLLFSVSWFVTYTTAGSWLKVRLIHFKADPAIDVPRRYGPVIVSHILSSVLFVNPWLLFYMLFYLNAKVNNGYLLLTISILYFLAFGTGTDCLVTRLLPKWSGLKWLEYRPPIKRSAAANLVVSIMTLAVAFTTSLICAR
jgi:hypothetical protein